MKIFSWNVNGIRAAAKKDLVTWFKKEKPDILCLQEIKAFQFQFPEDLTTLKGYYLTVNSAKKPGYAGVAVFSKEKPKKIISILGDTQFDGEGRMLFVEFSKFFLINLYLPHGGRAKEKLVYKLRVYKKIIALLGKFKNKPIVVTGDFNIARAEIDLARPKQNTDNIMFTLEERQVLNDLISVGYVDSFRHLHPSTEGVYTWWSYRTGARERNIGWRIDYIFTSKILESKIFKSGTLPKILGSDHCPIFLELK